MGAIRPSRAVFSTRRPRGRSCLRRVIDLVGERPDLAAILRWSIDSAAVGRYQAASQEFREAALAWLAETAGPTATAVFQCIAVNQKPDAVPIGLAAGVIHSAKSKGKLEKAAGKMEERYLGRSTPDQATIERWNAVATDVVRLPTIDQRLKGTLVHRADEILLSLDAGEFAYLSSTSPLGFAQRLERFGTTLSRALDAKGAPRLRS